MQPRAPIAAAGVLAGALVGCARTVPATPTTPATTTPSAVCPTVALAFTPRPWPKPEGNDRRHPCARPTPTPGAYQLPFGADLDEALHCVELYYTGPDGLPIDAMLKGALDALTRVEPDAQRAAAASLLDDVTDVPSLTRTLLRVAKLARATVGKKPGFAPELILLRGAYSALAWQTQFHEPSPGSADDKPPESFTAVAKDNLAYIKVGSLSSGTARRFRSELSWRQPVRGVILDLRGSPGGLYEEALAVADLFIRAGCLVVTRPPRATGHATARNQVLDVDAPLAVLVDHETGMGAELIAATLRARERAVIIGDKTLGRGLLQTIVMLSSGAMVKLTLAEMLAGDGTPFHDRGVDPDLAIPSSFEPDRGADRAIDLAKQILRQTPGAARRDLLQTARALVETIDRR